MDAPDLAVYERLRRRATRPDLWPPFQPPPAPDSEVADPPDEEAP